MAAIVAALVFTLALGIPVVADLNLILGGAAQVAYTNGDGVNVRDAAGYHGTILTTLGEGAEVTVIDGPVNADDGSAWYYVSAGDTEGWAIADYLTLPSGVEPPNGQTATVAFTNGYGVNLRAGPSSEAGVLTTLQEGTVVGYISGPEYDAAGNAWHLVTFEGLQGYLAGAYLVTDAEANAAGSPASTQDVNGQPADGSIAYVTGTGGNGLNLREASSTDAMVLVVLPEGAEVAVLATGVVGADGMEWWQLSYEGIVGYSAASYLAIGAVETPTETPAAEPAPSEQPAEEPVAEEPAEEIAPDPVSEPSEGEIAIGAQAQVIGTGGGGLNLRYEWGYDAGVISVASEGAIVTVLDGPVYDADGTPWYQVEASGVTGWANGFYLTYVADAPVEDGNVNVAEPTPTPAVAPSDPVGAAIVTEALRYIGLPYVWGGVGPNGFDCSGFVYYVLNNMLGISVSRSLEVQATSGSYVDYANMTPGDLVFFQNTYKWGLSHVGIYIGDGQFVHAGSERTGVLISDLGDPYWESRFYTARSVR